MLYLENTGIPLDPIRIRGNLRRFLLVGLSLPEVMFNFKQQVYSYLIKRCFPTLLIHMQ